jgi:hypothetical protein
VESHVWDEKGQSDPGGGRRFFLVSREVPHLLIGATLGDPVALRRILGGRRAGRIGLVIFAVGLFCAFPPGGIAVGLLAQVAMAWILGSQPRSAPPLRYAERLRLSLWTTTPPLVVALPLRLLFASSVVPGLVAVLFGHALLLRGLTTGLRSPPRDP